MEKDIVHEAVDQLDKVHNFQDLSKVKSCFLGKSGQLAQMQAKLSTSSKEEKKSFGKKFNDIKDKIEELVAAKESWLRETELQHKLKAEKIDLTIPGKPRQYGSIHPITQALEEIVQIFGRFGFVVTHGPSIEDEWHNFDALNMPLHHPARQMHDTFYFAQSEAGISGMPCAKNYSKDSGTVGINKSASNHTGIKQNLGGEPDADAQNLSGGLGENGVAIDAQNLGVEHGVDVHNLGVEPQKRLLLRTHTSPIQIRAMRGVRPPFRFICPGRTYRSDYDATHSPMFHQVEGIIVEHKVHMGHLKFLMMEFLRLFFEQSDIDISFVPSYFPFTEPSAEVSVRWSYEGGERGKWLEVLGCGMVHPEVLSNVGIDPAEYQGIAFGLGVERVAMLKYGINDLRQFFEGNLEWIRQYSFSPFDVPNIIGGLTR